MSSWKCLQWIRLARRASGLVLFFAVLFPWTAQAEKKKNRESIEADTAIFATNSPVLRVRLDFDRQALDSLRRDPRKFVRGRFTEFTGGVTNVSRVRPVACAASMTIPRSPSTSTSSIPSSVSTG
jgi:hypothetical protein